MAYDVERVAEHLRRARAGRHVTQREVAETIDVSEAAVVQWENGQGRMTLTNAWKLADYYGLALDELFGREVPALREA